MKKLLAWAEQIFTIASLILYSGGVLGVILSGGASEGDGGGPATTSSLILAAFMLIYFITFLLLVVRWKKTLYVLSKDKFIWVLSGFTLLSIFWTVAPDLTIRRLIAILGTSLFGLYLASRYSLKQQLKILTLTFGISILLSFIFGIALRKYGIMGGIHAGTWRGIYVHKNVLGKMMVLSGILFLTTGINAKGKQKFLLLGGCFLSLILIQLSTSKTSLINFMMLIAAFVVYRTLRWRYDRMIPAILGILTLGYGISIWWEENSEVFFNAIGKDSSLTGRKDIWPLVIDRIGRHPWIGHGFGAFWGKDFNAESATIWYTLWWRVPNAHSGILDLWLDLGAAGVTIYMLGLLFVILKGLLWLRWSHTPEGLWPVMYITYLILANLAESSLMIPNDLFWVIYVTIALSIQLPAQQQLELYSPNLAGNLDVFEPLNMNEASGTQFTR